MKGRPSYTDYPRTILWLVPGGRTLVGGDEPDSQPRFEVEVEPFYLSKWPITNEQFAAFDPSFERSPVSAGDRDTAVGISLEMAEAYCRWYAEVSRKPMRLPAETEWEHACRGGASGLRGGASGLRGGASGRWYWGEDERAADDHLWDRRNVTDLLPAPDRKRANGFGLHAMLGGVWEWTSSPWEKYPLVQPAARGGATETSGLGVLRGGSFRLDRDEISCSLRRAAPRTLRADDVGFRVAKSLR